MLGVIPFTILFDRISANFPNHTSLLIGVAFMAVVYFLPGGVIGLVEDFLARHGKRDLGRGERISEAVE